MTVVGKLYETQLNALKEGKRYKHLFKLYSQTNTRDELQLNSLKLLLTKTDVGRST